MHLRLDPSRFARVAVAVGAASVLLAGSHVAAWADGPGVQSADTTTTAPISVTFFCAGPAAADPGLFFRAGPSTGDQGNFFKAGPSAGDQGPFFRAGPSAGDQGNFFKAGPSAGDQGTFFRAGPTGSGQDACRRL